MSTPKELFLYCLKFSMVEQMPMAGLVMEKNEALGEVLHEDRLVSAPYKLDFKKDKDTEVACKRKLSKDDVAHFRNAVQKDFYFQMYYDDLPMWGFIGKVEKEGKVDPSEYKYFLSKHIQFDGSSVSGGLDRGQGSGS